jgi:TolB-like protein/DNA-binding winged helix-turn-helix (wHTH) protein/Tfp pilus assembly protein PilF
MKDKPNEKTYFFEDFQLDASRKLLLRLPGGEAVSLTHKAFEVLLVLVENCGKLVTKDELMANVWEDSFVEEANLTQTISVLRKTLGENPNQHRFIVTEPGKGYRFVAQLKELNENDFAENAKFEENISASPPVEKSVNQQIDLQKTYLPIFAILLLTFSIIGIYYFWNKTDTKVSQPSTAKEVKAIAVLPFKNIDSNDENGLLGIGMADAVITRLSQTKSIIVRQTNAVIRYADTTPEAIKVGREINVDAVLDGKIQKANGRIRVSVRLYRVKDGALLWAESFDEFERDIFSLQDSIAEKVANSLSLELNSAERNKLKHRYTENIEAYQLYNKGRFFWNNRNSDDLRKSISFYEQAIAKDENYALAYAGLAETYVLLHTYSPFQEKDAFPKAKLAAERALNLDENLAEAHTALAMYKEQYEYNWEGAEIEFKKAISANPSYATAHQWYGEFLAFMGRTEESIVQVEKAFKLDPLSLSTNTARAFPYLAARQYDKAIEELNLALELEKDFPIALYYLGRSYDGKGLYKESIAQHQKAIASSGKSTYFISALIYALAKNGQKTEAQKAFSEVSEIAKRQTVSKYVLARCYAGLGEKEKALDKLEKAFQERDSLMIVMKIEQIFDEIRDEPRFQELLNKMNF